MDELLKSAITPQQAWFYRIVPKDMTGNCLTFFIDENSIKEHLCDELEILLEKGIKLERQSTEEIDYLLHKFYPINYKKEGGLNKSSNVLPDSDQFVPFLINEARALGSSDIHIEVYNERARIRFRIDGLMVERYQIKKPQYPSLINKVKIMANLDIAEKRLPQDGRIFYQNGLQKFDIRISVLPTLHGEKIVLRLLGTDASYIDLAKLGFNTDDLDTYLEGVNKPHGIILISGPTGSGKTTTLYATLNLLNKTTRNIVTIEDPIEYTLEGVNQVQLRENIGLTFSSALRTFLRQDPDIIMLGEIRDQETAAMAIRASLTGHLVLSTIHTNSAWGTITRLADMGIPPYLIAETMNLSVAQRLIRLLCPTCKIECEPEQVIRKQFQRLNLPLPEFFFKAKGCEHCNYTGFKGRKAVYEVININHDVAYDIKDGVTDVRDIRKKYNIRSLQENALEFLTTGVTSLSEVYPILISN